MAATSLKMPDELKRRLESLASSEKLSMHAFMLKSLEREAARLELRARFAADAEAAEAEVMTGGKTVPLDVAFKYLSARVRGEPARRPRPRAWRKST